MQTIQSISITCDSLDLFFRLPLKLGKLLPQSTMIECKSVKSGITLDRDQITNELLKNLVSEYSHVTINRDLSHGTITLRYHGEVVMVLVDDNPDCNTNEIKAMIRKHGEGNICFDPAESLKHLLATGFNVTLIKE